MLVPDFAWLRNLRPSRALRPADGWAPLSWPVAAALLVALYVAWAVVAHYRSPLRRYPGPFLARWTNLWRFYHTLRGDIHLVNLRTHARYGPVVRTGPNHLELDRPDLVRTLYGADGRYRKTDFYPPASNVVGGRVVYNLFSLVDPAEHARAKRPVAKLYSLAATLQLEGRIDETLGLLCRSLEARFLGAEDAYGPVFDLGLWIKMYTWDVIGQITFSKRFGYLEAGRDFDGRLWLAEIGSDYLASASQLPWLDRWIDKNPVCPVGGATVLLGPTLKYLEDRYRDLDGGGGGDGKNAAAKHDDNNDKDDKDDSDKDFLDRFIQAKHDHPDVVDDHRVLSYLAINMLAGADTTAITIKAVLYHVLRTPRVRARLEADLVAADLGDAQRPPAFAAVRPLPYLEAVVREAMRLHPAVAMTLPRYVPDDAAAATGPPLVLGPDDGRGPVPVPPGTSVGMNPFVLGRNRAVWGADADVFRPERWLRAADETEAAFAARCRAMHSADLTFGAGARVCLGRHLALVEVYKVVAMLLGRYDLTIVDADKELWVRNGFFLRQEGPRVRMRVRG